MGHAIQCKTQMGAVTYRPPKARYSRFSELESKILAMKVFQPFRLDTANHCLWRADQRVDLAPKAFDVLRYLVEHSDRLVTQDEILEALWPGTYVNPEVVKNYVLELAKFWETIPTIPHSSLPSPGGAISSSPR